MPAYSPLTAITDNYLQLMHLYCQELIPHIIHSWYCVLLDLR